MNERAQEGRHRHDEAEARQEPPCEIPAAPREEGSRAQSQERGDEDEVRVIRHDPNAGAEPADEGQFPEQRGGTDHDELPRGADGQPFLRLDVEWLGRHGPAVYPKARSPAPSPAA
jgi:hypothetical protein